MKESNKEFLERLMKEAGERMSESIFADMYRGTSSGYSTFTESKPLTQEDWDKATEFIRTAKRQRRDPLRDYARGFGGIGTPKRKKVEPWMIEFRMVGEPEVEVQVIGEAMYRVFPGVSRQRVKIFRFDWTLDCQYSLEYKAGELLVFKDLELMFKALLIEEKGLSYG